MSRTEAIVATLVAYNVVMVTIGIVANRMSRDDGDYFLGGRRLGPFVAALSASASSSSVWTLLGVSGFAYGFGLAAIWLLPACIGGFALNWYVLGPGLRRVAHRSGAITVPELLAGPPGSERRREVIGVASLIILLSLLTYVSAQFQGAGITFVEAFDMRFEWALLLGAGIVIFYTLLGGFWAVSLTDTVQGMVMVLAALLLPIIALARAGVGEVATSLAHGLDGEPVGWWTAASNGLPAAAALGFILGLLGIGLGYPGQPHVVNRYMALRDEHSLVVGRRISMLWALIVYTGMIALGWGMRVLEPSLPNGEDAFVHATELLLSPVFAGVMIAALLSAIMSTVDSQLLVAASTISYDLIGQAGVMPPDHAAQLRRSRLTVLGVSLGALLVALWADESIFSSVLFAWTAMGSAFGPLLLVIVLVGRPRATAVLASMSAGFLLSVAAHGWSVTHGGAFERVLPFVVALAIAWRSARQSRDHQAGAQPRAGR